MIPRTKLFVAGNGLFWVPFFFWGGAVKIFSAALIRKILAPIKIKSALPPSPKTQRKRDDNKNKICTFHGGVRRGAGRKIVQNAIFHGKRHDNKILKVQILLSRSFVVMAQAPKTPPPPQKRGILWTWVFLQKERIFSRCP